MKVLEVGGRRGAHVVTVPTRWQAERAKAIGEGRDERGGLEDFAGGLGMCGEGLREVGTR